MRGWTRLDEDRLYLDHTAVGEGYTEVGDQLRQRGFRVFLDGPRGAQPRSLRADKARVGAFHDANAVPKIEYRPITAPQPPLLS